MRAAGCWTTFVVLSLASLSARAQTPTSVGLPSESRPSSGGSVSAPPVFGVPGLGADETTAGGLYSLQPGLPMSLSGPIDPAVYRLGPGDVLLLQIWGKVSRSVPIEVGPEGSALIPGSAIVRVSGRTLADFRVEVLHRMSQQYRGVSMDLRLARPRTFRVYLTGEVRVPGPAEATGAMRVGDLVTDSTLAAIASRRRIEVRHTDGSTEIADLDLFLRVGDARMNPWLRDGDVIHVPTATEFVWAEGAVARPGRYELGVRDSVRTVLMLAGDPLPSSVIDRVLVVRFETPARPESLIVSLQEIYNHTKNPPVGDGTRVYVYFLAEYNVQHEVTIVGEVRRPGVYPVPEGGTHLSELVAAAMGFRPAADLTAIRVHRRSSMTGERDPELDRLLRLSRNELTATEYEVMRTKLAGLREDYRVDWTRSSKQKDLDLVLYDGDIVRIERVSPNVRVDGEVQRPGIYNYVRGQSVQDYVAQAGGFTSRAWRGKMRVTRAVNNQTLFARNVGALAPGDLVWVPEKPDVTAWQQTREILTALAQVATVVIAIRSVR